MALSLGTGLAPAVADTPPTPEPGTETPAPDPVGETHLTEAKLITLRIGNQPVRTRAVTALTVRQALQEASVQLSKTDRVRPALTATVSEGTAITVTRVKYRRIVKTKALPHRTVVKRTAQLYRGERRVAQPGERGKARLIFKRTIVNGEAKSTKRIKTRVVRYPAKRVVLVGTQARPTLSGVWRELAQCESGGNPRIVSSNGLYHGLFQFSVGTWHSVGGSGLPSHASVGEQLKRAKILQARSGWGQWPHCSSAIGVR